MEISERLLLLDLRKFPEIEGLISGNWKSESRMFSEMESRGIALRQVVADFESRASTAGFI